MVASRHCVGKWGPSIWFWSLAVEIAKLRLGSHILVSLKTSKSMIAIPTVQVDHGVQSEFGLLVFIIVSENRPNLKSLMKKLAYVTESTTCRLARGISTPDFILIVDTERERGLY